MCIYANNGMTNAMAHTSRDEPNTFMMYFFTGNSISLRTIHKRMKRHTMDMDNET